MRHKLSAVILFINLFFLAGAVSVVGSAEKPSLMMAPLEAIDTAPGEARILSDALLNSLIRTNAFQAVERRDLRELLNEMSLSLSDIMNQDTSMLKPGLIQSAQVACLGTVGKIGDAYVLQARCADVNTGALLGATSIYCTGSIDCLLALTDKAARELAGLDTPAPSAPESVSGRPKRPAHSDHMEWSPVTNSDFAAFINAGGYTNPAFWSETGRRFITLNTITRPNYWTNPNLNQPSQPVTGISLYEAEAYCTWAGRRLPGVEEGLSLCENLPVGFTSRSFFWTNEEADVGFNCNFVIKNCRKTFSQKDIRNDTTRLVTGSLR
jgi:hypothetical protein